MLFAVEKLIYLMAAGCQLKNNNYAASYFFQ